ncbi:MAG TPA: adenylosuccinate lyase family protein [Acidimicrobiales bacterium]|nr:adenylosuccinate lyase family protein [Acidimicrobiales bacterium]
MGARLTDSAAYAHLWGTDETRALLDEPARWQRWLDILVALAAAQADLALIPSSSAETIARLAGVEHLDLDVVAAETRRTAHSTLGLIRALQRVLPEDVAQHVYYGATVQDLTDTWFGLTMRDVGDLVRRDLQRLIRAVAGMAAQHERTVMPGRTHAQPGAPISFGFKLATWADELGRHLERVREGRPRWSTAQLGGAVGTLGFYGEIGPALRARFAERLGLADPGIAWFTSRDRVAEFAAVMTGITGTLARIGNEVMELQRPEIGELHEAVATDVVGSIMMPHKRNPESSEHLDTLARLTRASAMVLIEGQVQLHERDGRPWKAEWVALPEVCLLTATGLRLAIGCIEGLEVDVGRMSANVAAADGQLASEQILGTLSARLGKHRAQAALQDVLGAARRDGRSTADAVVAAGLMSRDEADAAVDGAIAPGDTAAVRSVLGCVAEEGG